MNLVQATQEAMAPHRCSSVSFKTVGPMLLLLRKSTRARGTLTNKYGAVHGTQFEPTCKLYIMRYKRPSSATETTRNKMKDKLIQVQKVRLQWI
eukprot:scaffold9780_cov80-Skeletonema_menzelii.AAC.4